jgi:hypothetical protein
MIKKLSLAAIVAMGSMTVANAADLSEAIKGVNASGYLRYRYTSVDGSSNNTNEYKAKLKLSANVDENMKVGTVIVAKNKTTENEGAAANSFNMKRAYLQYSKAGASLLAGQISIDTPLSDGDDDYGTGAIASYSVNDAFTPIVAAFSASNLGDNNIYAVAAKGSIDAVSYQAFYYDVEKLVKYAMFAEVNAKVAGQTLIAQYAARKDDVADAKTDSYISLAVAGSAANVDYTVAYLNFGSNGAKVNVGSEATGLVTAGELTATAINDGTLADHKGNALAAVVSADVSGVSLGLDLVYAKLKEVDNTEKTTLTEYTLRASTKYSKQLKFSSYYALQNVNNDVSADDKTTELRFEAKYSF